MFECKICNIKCNNRSSLAAHIRLNHKILINEYFIKYDRKYIECPICKNNKNNPQDKICKSKYCRQFVCYVRDYNKYRRRNDYFGIFDPEEILTKNNYNVKLTLDELKYRLYFRKFLLLNSNMFLPNIFYILNLDQVNIKDFIKRIKL